MKLLSTEQQQDLAALLQAIDDDCYSSKVRGWLDYWKIELKPKRVRKKPLTTP